MSSALSLAQLSPSFFNFIDSFELKTQGIAIALFYENDYFAIILLVSILKLIIFYLDFLYLSPSQIYELPSFRPATPCTVPPHPVQGLYGAVAGLHKGSLIICGGGSSSLYYININTNI